MCEDIADQGNNCTDRCLAADAISRPVHLEEECDSDDRANGSANRSEQHVLDAKRGENVAARHDEKAGKPRPSKLFGSRTDKPACAQIIECKPT